MTAEATLEPSRSIDGDALANQAAQLLRTDPNAALARFEYAFRAFVNAGDADNASAVAGLVARTWQRKGNAGPGVRWARRGVVLAPDSDSAWRTLGIFYEAAAVAAGTSSSKRERALAMFSLAWLCYMRAAALNASEPQRAHNRSAANNLARLVSALPQK